MKEQLVSEPIKVESDTMHTPGMARGEPGLPGNFGWRGKEYRIDEVLENWKETGPCSHGSGEKYVRKHWYRIRTGCGREMKIYFERKTRSAGGSGKRWWIYTVTVGGDEQ